MGMEAVAATITIAVGEIMTPEVVTVTPETPVENAARMLFSKSVSGMPVVDAGGKLVGVVTEFDIIAKEGTRVSDIMTSDVITVSEDTDAETVARILTSRRVRRVPVTRDGAVVGIVSRSDLVRLFAMTRWSCETCGFFTRGFERLGVCPKCGSETIILEREPPGM
jgi:CBS domain-containing protein